MNVNEADGLLFLGFPLHPPKKPSVERAAHLAEVAVPMLFLQGAADALAELQLLQPVIGSLGPRAALKIIPAADHSFHVPARSGQTDGDVMEVLLDTIEEWVGDIIARPA